MTAAPGRRSSTFTRLLRHGFTDPSAAERLLDSGELSGVRNDPVLLEALGATADPDLALHGLVRLLEAQPDRELLDTVIAAKPLRDRLLGVLGASAALAEHLARPPASPSIAPGPPATGPPSSPTSRAICPPASRSSNAGSPRPPTPSPCA